MLGRGEAEFFAPGKAPCVVALHGFTGTAAELRPLLDAIARAGYAVDAAVLPGHGTRADNLQDQTFDDWLAAARARFEAARAAHGRAVLLGFSLGSLVAIRLAAELPSGLAGLVALGSALNLRPLAHLPLRTLARWRVPMPDLYLRKPRPGDVSDRTAHAGLLTYDRHPLRAALEVYRAGAEAKAWAPRVGCPTLVLHGMRDRVCPFRNATWLADHVAARDVTVRLFEKSAHILACDRERDEVATEVVAFLDRLRVAG